MISHEHTPLNHKSRDETTQNALATIDMAGRSVHVWKKGELL